MTKLIQNNYITKTENLVTNLTDISSILKDPSLGDGVLMWTACFLRELNVHRFEGEINGHKIFGSYAHHKYVQERKSPVTLVIVESTKIPFDLIHYAYERYSVRTLIKAGHIVLYIEPSDVTYDIKLLIQLLDIPKSVDTNQINLLSFLKSTPKALDYIKQNLSYFNKCIIIDGKFPEVIQPSNIPDTDKLLLIHPKNSSNTPIKILNELIQNHNSTKLVIYKPKSKSAYNWIKVSDKRWLEDRIKQFQEKDSNEFMIKVILNFFEK
jgi:hypothetical protein